MNISVEVGLSSQQLWQRQFGSLSGLGGLDFCEPSGGAASVLLEVSSSAVGRLSKQLITGVIEHAA
jgi:hypothetical protein